MMELFKTLSLKKEKNLKEKLSDKYYRLKQNDSVSFNKLAQVVLFSSTHQKVKYILLRAIRPTIWWLEDSNSCKTSLSIPFSSTTPKFQSRKSQRCSKSMKDRYSPSLNPTTTSQQAPLLGIKQ